MKSASGHTENCKVWLLDLGTYHRFHNLTLWVILTKYKIIFLTIFMFNDVFYIVLPANKILQEPGLCLGFWSCPFRQISSWNLWLLHTFPAVPCEPAPFSPIIVVLVVRLDVPPGGPWYIPRIALCISVCRARTKFGMHSQTSQFFGCNWMFMHLTSCFLYQPTKKKSQSRVLVYLRLMD